MTKCCCSRSGSGQGRRSLIRVPVTEDLGGLDIDLWVHEITGRRPGPTLALLSTLHGSEWQSIETIRRILDAVDADELCGTILALPVGNPVSLCYQTRNVPDESDSPDVNRSFSSVNTWIADQLAQMIASCVLDRADAMIDWHPGWGGS